jgi:heparin binding hemagglutinin HbhA
MARVADIRKTVTDSTPVYAVVGATDLAVEKVREARTRLEAARVDLDVAAVQGRATEAAQQAVGQAQHVPVLALNRTLVIAGKAQESYDSLAARGHKLVRRIRNQKATKDLLAQAGTTLALSKGAVTTLRKAAVETERAAKATLTTGRREAASAAATVGSSAKGTTTTAKTAAKKATRATKPAAKRTATTARKRATTTKSATKAAVTSAAKTAEAAQKTVETAAEKVGD